MYLVFLVRFNDKYSLRNHARKAIKKEVGKRKKKTRVKLREIGSEKSCTRGMGSSFGIGLVDIDIT